MAYFHCRSRIQTRIRTRVPDCYILETNLHPNDRSPCCGKFSEQYYVTIRFGI